MYVGVCSQTNLRKSGARRNAKPFSIGGNMTREERKQRKEAIIEYRKAGHYIRECAERFGVSREYVKSACRGIDYPWKVDIETMRQAALKQNRDNPRGIDIDSMLKMIDERTPDFEYAGNYTGADGYLDLRCKVCGTVTKKSYCAVKHGTAFCYECQRREADRRREEREADKARRAAQRKRERELNRKTKQLSFRQCAVCGRLFYGDKVYCSAECRQSNHWRMKDGYRYLFPLAEVFKRDKGICYLCGGLCDWNDYTEKDGVVIYGNNYPSRDHVQPKSKGGGNTWDNIRLAHRICNIRKSNSPAIPKTG